MTLPPVSIVIPSYNGKAILEKHLPKTVAALAEYAPGGELIVVEDGGSDGTTDRLAKNFPGVRAIYLEKNLGFAGAANFGVKSAANKFALILNNDMSPEPGYIRPLVERIDSAEDIFAVSSRSIVADGTDESPTTIFDDDGILKIKQPGLGVSAKPFGDKCVTVSYAAGGFSVFRKKLFLELGGFDDLYRPFYWEDADLSWKAWKLGYRTLYEPRAALAHESHATIGRLYKTEQYDLTNHTNLHLFNMRHLDSRLLETYFRSAHRIQSEINAYDRGMLRRAFFKALTRLDEVIEKRNKDAEPKRRTEEIIELSAGVPVD